MDNENTPVSSAQERYILEALADVRKFIFYKLGSAHRDAAEDLMQRVFCKVWSWNLLHRKILEYEDWRRFTRTTAGTEIAEYFSEKYQKDIVFSQADADLQETIFSVKSSNRETEAEERLEVQRILLTIWKSAQILSLRQRYAFVLQSDDFLIEVIETGLSGIKELAVYFELAEEEMADIISLMPLSDGQIGELLAAKLNEPVLLQQIWEARSKAKSKLSKSLKQLMKKETRTKEPNNERLSIAGNTGTVSDPQLARAGAGRRAPASRDVR